ncbi:MAG: AAA family ATPase [Pseudomonadota bacterium]
MPIPTVRLFVSSPGDVNEERIIAERVISRLTEEFSDRAKLEPIFWEHEPMLMSETFQTQITPPSETEIFVCILWARIGTRLPAQLTRPDGSRYASGTEFELEDAWNGFQAQGKPEIMVYRKMAEPPFLQNSKSPDFADKLAQKEALEDFCRKWFQDEEDGTFIRAFNPFDNLAQFEERLEEHLRKLLERHYPLDEDNFVERPSQWRRGSPFRGLQMFEAEHSSIFFGRTRAIGEVLELLRRQAQEDRPFLAVMGMSGSGKSSLVRAGVLPLLTQAGVIEGVAAWRQCILRPVDLGSDLVSGLSRALLDEGALPMMAEDDEDTLQRVFNETNIDALKQFIAGRLSHYAFEHDLLPDQVRIVLLIDHLEDLFIQDDINDITRTSFILAIDALVQTGLVWVLTTFRSDFYYRCEESSILAELLKGYGHYLLMPPSPSEISQMIQMPAKAASLEFEKHPDTQIGLDEVLLDAMVQNPHNLALLQFTLDALYKQRLAGTILTYEAYDVMGGLSGALAQRAEGVFLEVGSEAQTAFPALMRTLVTWGKNEDVPVMGRRWLDYGSTDAPTQSLLDAFIRERLLVTDRMEDGTAFAMITHETLLHHWPRLQEWVNDERHLLRTRARVTDAAQHWEEESELSALLLQDGKPLLDAENLLERWRGVLKPVAIRYIEKSITAHSQRREEAMAAAQQQLKQSRRLSVIFGGLAALALVGLYFGYLGAETARQSAQDAQRHAEAAEAAKQKALSIQSVFLAERAQQETQHGNATNGVLFSLAALPQDMKKPNRNYVSQAEASLYNSLIHLRESHVIMGHSGALQSVAFGHDDQYIVTASEDETVRLWSSAQGAELQVFKGHQHIVNHAVFSPDGRYIATASEDKTVRLWRVEDGAQLHILTGHDSSVAQLSFSHDGSRLISASSDTTAKLWNVENGELITILKGHDGPLYQAIFNPNDAQILTISADTTARLWDATSGALLYVLEGHQEQIWYAAFSPNGKHIAMASADKTVSLWHAEDWSQSAVLDVHKNVVYQLAFSHDSQYLVTASADKSAIIWNVAQGEALAALRGHSDEVDQATFSPDDEKILTVSGDTLKLWDARTGALISPLRGHTGTINQAVFSSDSRRIASVSEDKTLRLWHVELPELKTLQAHRKAIFHIAFDKTGQRLLSVADDGLGYIWQMPEGNPLRLLRGHVHEIAQGVFSHDGKRVITASFDGTARLWDTETGRPLTVLEGHQDILWHSEFSLDDQRIVTTAGNSQAPGDTSARLWDGNGKPLAVLSGHQEAVRHAAFSPDGAYVATASLDGLGGIWRAQDGELLHWLEGHEDSLRYVAFSPDGRFLATASNDETVRIWSVASGELRRVYRGHNHFVTHVAFSPDGRTLLSTSWDKTARLWLTANDTPVILSGHKGRVTHGQFSPDGRYIVTASEDRTARIWKANDGATVAVLSGHDESVTQAAFSPDSRYVVTASVDTTLRVWPVFEDVQILIDTAQARVPRTLTDAQKSQFFMESSAQ